MNYTQAVQLAKEGKEEGYKFLYESTYKSKFYLALKYMNNEESAKDVVQEAYIKAFSKLNTLEQPETFSSWLGTIVANTAKNELQKKNHMLFSSTAVNAEEEAFEYQIEDSDWRNQPENAYSRKEIDTLVRELINSLSEEQKMCILMFHIEEMSISSIAAALNCSENTVKSRLNYGRKNLKAKVEDLQKKGYKFYSVAPVGILMYLLMSEQKSLDAEGVLSAMEAGAEAVMPTSASAGASAAAPVAATMTVANSVSSASSATAEIAKKGFFRTVKGKIVIIAVCAAAAAGAAVLAITVAKPFGDIIKPTASITESTDETDVGNDSVTEEQTAEDLTVQEITTDEPVTEESSAQEVTTQACEHDWQAVNRTETVVVQEAYDETVTVDKQRVSFEYSVLISSDLNTIYGPMNVTEEEFEQWAAEHPECYDFDYESVNVWSAEGADLSRTSELFPWQLIEEWATEYAEENGFVDYKISYECTAVNVRHEDVTETVHHDAVTEEQTVVDHYECQDCGEVKE